MRRRYVLPMLAALTGLLVSSAQAKPPRGGEKRALVLEQMRKARRKILIEDVGLDAKTAAKVEAILVRHSAEQRRVRREMQQQRRALRALLEANSNDEKAYATALNKLRELQRQLHRLEDQELEDVGKHLTAKQQAKFGEAVREAQRKMREAIREARDQDD